MNLAEKKTLNAILYFVEKTNYCYKTKLFKLLYFWDFLNIKHHGESITGYTYVTFPKGPVPVELYNQITHEELPEEFRKSFSIVEYVDDDDKKSFRIIPKKGVKIDLEWLSKSEMESLEQIAYTYIDSSATQMSELTHLKNTPWSRTMEKLGLGKTIDYLLALDDQATISREEAEERITLQKELKSYGRA